MKLSELRLIDNDYIFWDEIELRRCGQNLDGYAISLPVHDQGQTRRHSFKIEQFCDKYVRTPNIIQRIILGMFGRKVFSHKLSGVVKIHKEKLYKTRNSK